MSHRRAGIRAVVRSALAAAPRFASFKEVTLWQAKVDAETLPIYGVATPSETKDHDAQNSAERVITVIVAIKRRGLDELEDLLDDNSDAVEALALSALRGAGIEAQLDRTDVTIEGAADKRVGTLTQTFRAFVQTDEPLSPQEN